MRAWWYALALGAGAVAPAPAAALPAAPARQEAAEEADEDTVAAVQNDYFATLRKNAAKAQESKAPAMTLLSEEQLQALIERCFRIYDVSEGEPAEFDALAQVLTLASSPYVQPTSAESLAAWREARDKLAEGFVDDDRAASLALNLPAPKALAGEAEAFSKRLAASKSVAVQAALAWRPLDAAVQATLESPSDEAERKVLADVDAFVAKHGEVKQVRGSGTYADWAKSSRKALANAKRLVVGAEAPDIEAADLDGVGFKLSDYRGKVVLLDFWGYW